MLDFSPHLVIPKIHLFRTRSGGYTCQAVNAVGKGRSQEMHLNVKCKWHGKWRDGAAIPRQKSTWLEGNNAKLYFILIASLNLCGAYGLEKPQIRQSTNFRGIQQSAFLNIPISNFIPSIQEIRKHTHATREIRHRLYCSVFFSCCDSHLLSFGLEY